MKYVIFNCYRPSDSLKDRLEALDKYELSELINDLSKSIDSGRHTGAHVGTLKMAVEIYIKKYEVISHEIN